MSNDENTERQRELGERIGRTERRAESTERRTEEAMRRTELALERTKWAERRTLLANERTFSAWLRTGLASIGGGLAVARLLGAEGISELLARFVGIILVIAGAAVAVLALWRFTKVSQILERENLPVLPAWVAWLLVGSLVGASVLVLVIIILG